MTGRENEFRVNLAKHLWNWEPHPTQRLWLLSDARTKTAACGRRWGKTEAAAVDVATWAIVEPGSVQIIVAPTYDQSKLIFDTVERLLTSSPITRSQVKSVKMPYPRLSLGESLIMARTADEDGRNLRGHSADRVIVDEAAYVRDNVVLEVISPMLADRNGQLVMISTPFGKNHFYRAFVRGKSGEDGGKTRRSESFSFPSWTNPHISREYIDEQRNELSPRQFAVEYEAQFLDDQASVFSWEEIQAAAARWVDGRSFVDFDSVIVGIDWARYSDYTAVVAVGVGDAECAVIGIDRFNRMSWDRQIERAAEFVERHRATAVLTDQTSIGDPLLEQLRARLWEGGANVAVEGLAFTNQSKRELVDGLSLRFAHGTIVIPHDEALISELQYFEYELTQSGNVRMNARSGYHDDLVMALALACRQAREMGCSGRLLGAGERQAVVGW